jgi:hypothetical protein
MCASRATPVGCSYAAGLWARRQRLPPRYWRSRPRTLPRPQMAPLSSRVHGTGRLPGRGSSGVVGRATAGEGVLGVGGGDSNGVHGQSDGRTSSGVLGESTASGYGVTGSTNSAAPQAGVLGIKSSLYLVAATGRATVFLAKVRTVFTANPAVLQARAYGVKTSPMAMVWSAPRWPRLRRQAFRA